VLDDAGAASPFGPGLLRVGSVRQTIETTEVLFGKISRRAYARLIYPFVVRYPEAPYFDVGGLDEVNKLPVDLVLELFKLLPKPKEEKIGEIKTRNG
jgi:hypothetical protein